MRGRGEIESSSIAALPPWYKSGWWTFIEHASLRSSRWYVLSRWNWLWRQNRLQFRILSCSNNM